MIKHSSFEKGKYDSIFMGIDQSLTHTGIVVSDKEKGIIDVRGISTKPEEGSIEQRILHIKKEVNEKINLHKPDIIFIESLAYRMNSNNGRLLAGLFFVLLTLFIEKNIRYVIINPKTLKKEVTGNGAASKDDMFKLIPEEDLLKIEKLGFVKKTSKKFEDLVDAYWLSKMYLKIN